MDPVRFSSRTSFSLESEFRLVSIYLQPTGLVTGRNEFVAKVIFLHLSVILFTGGGDLLECMLGRRHPPGKEAPLPRKKAPPTRKEALPPPPAYGH